MNETVTVKAGSTARRAAKLLAATVLLAAVGCGGQTIDASGEVGKEKPESVSDRNGDSSQAEQAPGRAYSVSAKGDERVRLRYRPEKGAEQHVDLGVDIGLTTTLNGKKQPAVDMPRVEVHGDYLIAKVSEDGSFTQKLSLSEWRLEPESEGQEGGIDPAAHKAIEQALKSIGTVTGSTTLGSRGEVLDSVIELPEKMPTQVRSMLEEIRGQLGNLRAPLPEEPVGVGSTWQSKNTLTLTEASFGKLDWETEYLYTLRKVDGDEVTIDVTYDQKAVPATLKDPDRPGTAGKITGGAVNGSGTMVVDLGLGAVTEGTLKADGTMDMRLKSGGKSGDVHYDLSYVFDIGGH